MTDNTPDDLPPWPGFDPDIVEALNAASEVHDAHGDEHDLVARLVTDLGEAEALRVLAKAALALTRTAHVRTQAMAGVAEFPDYWDERRCPTCDEICENCLDEAGPADPDDEDGEDG